MTDEELPLCECGCGEPVAKLGNRFINGHNRQGKKNSPEHCAANSKAGLGVPKSPEHCAAISTATLGIPKPPRTPEHCANMSEAHKDVPLSPEHIAAIKKGQEEAGVYESMRGGNDICNHHYIYDHNDLSKYTIKMTRSAHGLLHRNMYLLGIKIPHINTGHETEDKLKLMAHIKKIELKIEV
jgi:hypothetical protein